MRAVIDDLVVEPWSGQQDLNLRQLFVIAQCDSDKPPQNGYRGGSTRAEFLTFRRRSRAAVTTRPHGATQPPERPPDPGNGGPGAVATATGAEVQNVLLRTNETYREPDLNVQSGVGRQVVRAADPGCDRSRGRQ